MLSSQTLRWRTRQKSGQEIALHNVDALSSPPFMVARMMPLNFSVKAYTPL